MTNLRISHNGLDNFAYERDGCSIEADVNRTTNVVRLAFAPPLTGDGLQFAREDLARANAVYDGDATGGTVKLPASRLEDPSVMLHDVLARLIAPLVERGW